VRHTNGKKYRTLVALKEQRAKLREERAAKKAALLPQGISIPVDELEEEEEDDDELEDSEDDDDSFESDSEASGNEADINIVDDDAGFEIVRKSKGKRKVDANEDNLHHVDGKCSKLDDADDSDDDFQGNCLFYFDLPVCCSEFTLVVQKFSV
jgi:hypothetical protein